MTKIRVVLIEPLPMLVLGLETLFERSAPEFHIVGIYHDIPSFCERCHQKMDIILIDTSAIGYSRHLNIRDLFSGYSDTLLIALTTELLIPNVRASFDLELCLYDDEGQMLHQLRDILKKSATTSIDDNTDSICISDREKDVIIAVANGLTNKEIADNLCLSPHTIMSYRKKIALKLGLKGVAGFTAYAMVHNLVK